MWISKKEWIELTDMVKKAQAQEHKHMDNLYAWQQEYSKVSKELKKYKKLYLDELQKRLELADRVRELEGE